MRHLKLRNVDEIDEAYLSKLLKHAASLESAR